MQPITRIKSAVLTIDDGPSPDMVEKVDLLADRRIPAVFFCTGERLEQRPDQAIYAIRRGFVLGNHSYLHPHFSEIALGACRREIEQTDAILENLYRSAETNRPAKYFRFPYGDKGDGKGGEVFNPSRKADPQRKQHLQSFLRELGYEQPAFDGVTYAFYRDAGLLDDVDWHWTFDVMEWAMFEPRSILRPRSLVGIRKLSDVLRRIDGTRPSDCRGQLPRQPRWLGEPLSDEIILLHDHAESTAVFPEIIDHLLAKPLRFESGL